MRLDAAQRHIVRACVAHRLAYRRGERYEALVSALMMEGARGWWNATTADHMSQLCFRTCRRWWKRECNGRCGDDAESQGEELPR